MEIIIKTFMNTLHNDLGNVEDSRKFLFNNIKENLLHKKLIHKKVIIFEDENKYLFGSIREALEFTEEKKGFFRLTIKLSCENK